MLASRNWNGISNDLFPLVDIGRKIHEELDLQVNNDQQWLLKELHERLWGIS